MVRNSAENFAVTTLELGGKSPILVFDDADLESAANGLIAGNFGASGQSCVAGSRGLVHRPVFDALGRALIEDKAKAIVVGRSSRRRHPCGPAVYRAQIERIEATLARPVATGRAIRFGGAPR